MVKSLFMFAFGFLHLVALSQQEGSFHFDDFLLKKVIAKRGVFKRKHALAKLTFRDSHGSKKIIYSFIKSTSIDCIQVSDQGCCFCKGKNYAFSLQPISIEKQDFDSIDSELRVFINSALKFEKIGNGWKVSLKKLRDSKSIGELLRFELPHWKLIIFEDRLFRIKNVNPCCEFIRYPNGYTPMCPCADREEK